MNICKNCLFWRYCTSFRYNNVEKEYMIRVNRALNSDGDPVIYVEECKKFVKYKPFKGKIFK